MPGPAARRWRAALVATNDGKLTSVCVVPISPDRQAARAARGGGWLVGWWWEQGIPRGWSRASGQWPWALPRGSSECAGSTPYPLRRRRSTSSSTATTEPHEPSAHEMEWCRGGGGGGGGTGERVDLDAGAIDGGQPLEEGRITIGHEATQLLQLPRLQPERTHKPDLCPSSIHPSIHPFVHSFTHSPIHHHHHHHHQPPRVSRLRGGGCAIAGE